MSEHTKSVVRIACLALSAFLLAQVPFIQLDSKWSDVFRPLIIILGLIQALPIIAAGVSKSPGDTKQLEDLTAAVRIIHQVLGMPPQIPPAPPNEPDKR